MSEPAQILGRYSSSFTVVLGAMLGSTVVAGVLVVLSRAGRLPHVQPLGARWFGWAAVIAGLAAVILVWLYLQPASAHIPAIGLFRLYVVGLIIAGMFTALYVSGVATRQISSRWSLLLFVLIGGLALVFIMLFLGKTPAPRFFDEPWLVNWELLDQRSI